HQMRLSISAEVVVPIQHNLLVHPNFSGQMDDIQEIHSHHHAIAQCQQYIHQHISEATIYYTDSTGSPAALVSENQRIVVAIANTTAAKEYGLRVFEGNIHDYPNNHTRFIVLAKDEEKIKIDHSPSLERTTLLITLPEDRAGVLHQVLSAFAWRKMNLSK